MKLTSLLSVFPGNCKVTLVFIFLSAFVRAQSPAFHFHDPAFSVGQNKSVQIRIATCAWEGHFAFADESKQLLDSVSQFMVNNPSIHLEIASHTDQRGDTLYNQKLSLDQSQYIAKYLIYTGIDSSRLSATGKGEYFPETLYPSDSIVYNQLPAEFQTGKSIILTESFIRQFHKTNKKLSELLYQHNRRTVLTIIKT